MVAVVMVEVVVAAAVVVEYFLDTFLSTVKVSVIMSNKRQVNTSDK